MKHKIINQQKLDNKQSLISISLISESEEERKAIDNVEAINATDAEKEFIDNYLLFCLGDKYSIVSLENQKQNIFIVKVFEN